MEVAIMQQDIPKMCADSLRTFTKEKLNIKLKAAHAHELVAAYFGYSSKNAMLADNDYPISRIPQAKIVVMAKDSDINERRKKLQGLPPELPNSYALGEPIYTSLFSDKFWTSQHPPFRSFEKAAKFLVENNASFQHVFKFYLEVPLHHLVSVNCEYGKVTLSVIHATRTSAEEMIANGKTTIELRRVAGGIGYGEPVISVEQWTAGARKRLESFEGGHYV